MGAHSLLGVNKAAKSRLDDKNPCEYLDKHKTERRWIFKWSFMHVELEFILQCLPENVSNHY